MIHLIGIGPGDPELLTLKAARLLREADVIFVPQSNHEGRSVADVIIAPHADPGKIRHAAISMRSPERGKDPVYARLAKEMAEESAAGRGVVYVSLGDTLIYSTAQYLGRELDSLGARHEYVPGIPSFVAAASQVGIPLAAGREGLVVDVMPESAELVAELAECGETVVLLKVNRRMPALMEYVRVYGPATATLLHRIGLDGETVYDLTAVPHTPDTPVTPVTPAAPNTNAAPENIGYLSIAIIRKN